MLPNRTVGRKAVVLSKLPMLGMSIDRGTPLSTSGTLDMIPLAMSGMLATLWALLTSQGKAYVRTDRTAILSPVGEGRVGALQLLIPGTAGEADPWQQQDVAPPTRWSDGRAGQWTGTDGGGWDTGRRGGGPERRWGAARDEEDGKWRDDRGRHSDPGDRWGAPWADGRDVLGRQRDQGDLRAIPGDEWQSETRGSHEGTIMEASFGFPGQMVEMSLDGSAIRETDTADGMILGQLMGTIVGGTPVPMLFVRAGMEKTEMTGGGSGEHQRSSRSPRSRPRTQKTSEGARAPISARWRPGAR